MRAFDDRRVHVYGEKKIGVVLVGDGGALIERDDRVIAAGEHDARLQLRFKRGGEALAERERGVFFHQPAGTDRADFFAAVTRIDHDRVDAGRLHRPRRIQRLRRSRRDRRAFAHVEDDAERILEAVGIGDDVGRGQLDAQVVADERRLGHVRVVLRLLDVRRANGGLEVNGVRARLFRNRVIGRRGEREDDFRNALHVRDGNRHARRSRLRRMNLQDFSRRVPSRVETRSAHQKSLEELPRNERTIVDRHRRDRHLDQIVFHDAETAVGSERGHGVVQRRFETVAVARDGSAERGDHFIGGEIRLAVLVRDGNGLVAARGSQRGLIGGIRRSGRRCLGQKKKCRREGDRDEGQRASHRDRGIIARRIRRALALGASPSARTCVSM